MKIIPAVYDGWLRSSFDGGTVVPICVSVMYGIHTVICCGSSHGNGGLWMATCGRVICNMVQVSGTLVHA